MTATPASPAASSRDVPVRRGLDLFGVAGIRVRVDPSWIFVFLLVWWAVSAGFFPQHVPDAAPGSRWLAGLGAALLLFASILVHELAHALMSRHWGLPVPSITLFLFGGVSELRSEPESPRAELAIAIVGPLTSFALAGVFWALHGALALPGLGGALLFYLAAINLALGVFNLLPGLPLDGGRVLRALLWWRTGSRGRATRSAANVGKGLAVGLIVLGGIEILAGALVGGLWLVFVGLFMRSMASAGQRAVLVREALREMTVDDVMVRDVATVTPDVSVEALVEDVLRTGYRAFPVVEDGRAAGFVSARDVSVLPPERRATATVRDCMQPLTDEQRTDPDVSLADAFEHMQRQRLERLLVLRDGRLLGLLTRHALQRFVELTLMLRPSEAPEKGPHA